MPSVSPRSMEMSTCSTALTLPRRVANSTVRSRTLSRGTAVVMAVNAPPSRSPLRIDDVAQAIAEKIEAEHRDHQGRAREERDPPLAAHHVGRAFSHHDAPLGRRRTHAKADEREARGVEDGIAHG